MSISPVTDIVLDVARAADPTKQLAAQGKLKALAYDGGAGFSDVALRMQDAGDANGDATGKTGPRLSALPFDAAGSAVRMHNREVLGSNFDRKLALSATRGQTPAQKFEAFALRSFVEEMLPQNSAQTFGTGTAGNIWRSMMAEQIGNEFAKHGGLGIADAVERSMQQKNALASAGASNPNAAFLAGNFSPRMQTYFLDALPTAGASADSTSSSTLDPASDMGV